MFKKYQGLLASILFVLFSVGFDAAHAQTLSAPAAAAAGGDIKVAISGTFDSQDFVTIVAPDKPEGGYDHYVYARQAELELTVPDNPGRYEIRLLDGDGNYPTLHKLPLTVNPVSASVQAPESVAMGANFDVHWEGPGHKQDFITIVAADAAEREYGMYRNTRRGNPVQLTAPTTPGQYQVRYLTGGSYRTIGRTDIEVTATDAAVSFTPSATIGSVLAVNWEGPGNPQDFITVVEQGAERNAYTNYKYTRTGNPVELLLPEIAGDYEIRYLINATGGGYHILASEPLQIVDTAASVSGPAEAMAGSIITVSWTGPNNHQDYITAVPEGADNRDYEHFVYARTGSSGQLQLSETAGAYELRYLTGRERRVLARTPLTVLPASASLKAPDTVEAGQVFQVIWEGPGNQTDYIAVTPPGNPKDSRSYGYTRRGNPVLIEAPEEQGEYELHYLTGLKRHTLASQTLTVTPSRQPGTLRVVSSKASTPDSAFGAVELILDASGSMLQRLDGERRINIAKQTLKRLVNELLPANTAYALRVFGHRQPDACDTELVQALGPLNRSTASAVIDGIQAKNLARTPIADSLARVSQDLAGVAREALVILVTDGEETCDGDPTASIAALRNSGFAVRINIIGFAIDEYALKQEFARWAELGGGAYFDATDADALSQAMQQSLQTTFSVYDAGAQNVASGTVNGPAITLPPGDYQVSIGERRYPLTIIPNEDATLTK